MIHKLPNQQQLRSLYRTLLREGKRFPSVRRAAILEDIRLEWREKAGLTDPKKIQHAVELGIRGLDTMRKYTSLDLKSTTWSVTLEQDPLGAGQQQQPQLNGNSRSSSNNNIHEIEENQKQQRSNQFVPFGSSQVNKLE